MRRGARGREWWDDLLWALCWTAGLLLTVLCAGRSSKFIYIDF